MSLRWFFTSWKTRTSYFLLATFLLTAFSFLILSATSFIIVYEGVQGGWLLILLFGTFIFSIFYEAMCMATLSQKNSSLAIGWWTLILPAIIIATALYSQFPNLTDQVQAAKDCWHLRQREWPEDRRYELCLDGMPIDGPFAR